MPSYKAPVADTMFILNEIVGLDRLDNIPGFAAASSASWIGLPSGVIVKGKTPHAGKATWNTNCQPVARSRRSSIILRCPMPNLVHS